jgi:hypothetical protein
METAVFWTLEEVVAKVKEIYARDIQKEVETPENIGKCWFLM